MAATGFGAITGAMIAVGATVVTSVVTGQQITTGQLAGAAVNGALTGALIGAIGGALGGDPTGLIIEGAIAGSAGALAGSIVRQEIDQGYVDPEQLKRDTLLGAAGGALGATLGVAVAGAGGGPALAVAGGGSSGSGKQNCPKADSPQWQKLKPYRGQTKTNGMNGKDRRYYEWDHTHNDIEVFDQRGRHLGTMDPKTGKMTKPPVPGRNLKGV